MFIATPNRLHAKPSLTRPTRPRSSFKKLIVRALRGGNSSDADPSENIAPPASPLSLLAKSAALASALTAASSLVEAQAAQAAEFKPRRHHRRLPGWEEAHPEVILQAAKGAARQQHARSLKARRSAARDEPALSLTLPLPGSVPGLDQVSAAASAAQRAAQSAHTSFKRAINDQPAPVSVSMRSLPAVTPSYAKQHDAQTAYIVGGGVLALLAFFMWRGVSEKQRRNRKGGRWVRDRSLGGKEIWIPDELEASFSQTAGRNRAGSVRSIFTEEDLAIDPPTSSSSFEGRSSPSPSPSSTGRKVSLPAWWTEPRIRAVMDSEKEEYRLRASQFLRQMEELKFSGRDYSIDAIREMTLLCLEGQVTLKARTESGRDAIYRFATDKAIEAAFTGRTISLGGMRPREFLPALAQSLNVPTQKAAEIATGAVAAKTRALLLSALAQVRARDDLMAYTDLSYLTMLWKELPLEEASPQVDMLASSLSSVMSANEARTLLKMFEDAVGQGSELAGVMKETLLAYQA